MNPESRFLRLFVGIAVPDEVKAALQDAQREMREVLSPDSTAWTRPDAMHVTLRFLGAVEERRVPELARSLRTHVRDLGGVDLVCEGVGCFPDRRYPRVVWAGVHDGNARLPRLHEVVDHAVDGFAQKPAEVPFVGHVTLARIKHVRRVDAERLARFSDSATRLRFGTWRATEFALLQSEPSSTGSRYTTLLRFEL